MVCCYESGGDPAYANKATATSGRAARASARAAIILPEGEWWTQRVRLFRCDTGWPQAARR